MKKAIIIPARYGSTRLPGKPLLPINGKPLLSYVVAIAQKAVSNRKDCLVAVATDDHRIQQYCKKIGVLSIMTSPDCPTGSDRCLQAAEQLAEMPEYIVNLQGDAPLTPVSYIEALIDAYEQHPDEDVFTAVVQLSWQELDALRKMKQTEPFSGTTAVVGKDARALWFSKQILPVMRNEATLRQQTGLSPVRLHVGLYGYRADFLQKYVSIPVTQYEQQEGLEQLRILESGHSIFCTSVHGPALQTSHGVDCKQDLAYVENLFSSNVEAV